MKKYLLDTNICIFYMKGKYDLYNKLNSIGNENLFISEITLAELKYGIEKSENLIKNQIVLEKFLTGVQILPIIECLDFFAQEKARLSKAGILIDDFDLLIGSTAVAYNIIMVTNNTKHFERINQIIIEDWIVK